MMIRRLARLAALAATLTMAATLLPAVTATAAPSVQSQLSSLRNATAAYHDLGAAEADGFVPLLTCFSDPASTSGYLYPSYGLLKVGISPSTGVSPVFAGSDSTTAIDVAQGSCQVGFTNSFSLPQVYSQNHIAKSALKIIWTSPEIPASPLAASDSLPPSFRTALENLLVNEANSTYMAAHGYCSSEAECTKVTSQWGYAKPSLANYSTIGDICKITKSPSCTLS